MKVCLIGLVLLGIALSVSAFLPFTEDDNSVSDVEPKIPENPSHMSKIREKRGQKKKPPRKKDPPQPHLINSWSVDDLIPFTEYEGRAVHKMFKAEELRERREVEAQTDDTSAQQTPDRRRRGITTEEVTTPEVPQVAEKVKRQADFSMESMKDRIPSNMG